MTKKGFRWEKYQGFEDKIIKVLRKSETEKTINDIRTDLENAGLKTTWKTLRDYLYKMLDKKQVKLKRLGTRRPLLLWRV